MITDPFPHRIVKEFFNNPDQFLVELKKESFSLKDSDLFTFYQTNDLKSSDNEFIHFFHESLLSIIPQLEKETHLKLNNNIDIFGSLYQPTNYLLPHDDRLESRKIAYIYYLTTLKDNQGGALVLYKNKKPFKKIQPKKNTIIFFKVSKYSLHAIEEVLKGDRIAITGWFHGD